MAQQLDRQQVHRVSQLRVGVLLPVQLGRGGEGVHQHQRGFLGVVGMWHLVGGVDAAQMGHADDLGVRHGS